MIHKWTRTLTAFLRLSFSVSCVDKKEDNNTLLAALLFLAANKPSHITGNLIWNQSF
ncbi:hypothetical protein [Leptospira vanthielii]|uniref:Uncharacterized protein n=1 Tax=Leptospira vanthielii serovar Holland str. Waz Holland = ATCC 700522 TaxID=1218591 RepID=N1WCE7_9LEPT|nr:hypothetical protein [Leptospira vanthielii]EMY70887.1 hypothetical protein LEP1GSC199_0367 [Leptospira vanthielii serovar Holland str. Waz Holland = ATCC 700522]